MTATRSTTETLIPLRVANELVASIIGQTIYCAWFRIESCGDNTYTMTVHQESGDTTLTRLEDGTLWQGPA